MAAGRPTGGQGPAAPVAAGTGARPRDVPGSAAARPARTTPAGDQDEPDTVRPASAPDPTPASSGGGGHYADQGAGFVLGVLIWAWVLLPLLKGGPSKVKATLMAKFLNKAADGSYLP